MKKHLLTILATIFTTAIVVGGVVSTICFKVCRKRIDATDKKHWKIVDSDWEHLIKF